MRNIYQGVSVLFLSGSFSEIIGDALALTLVLWKENSLAIYCAHIHSCWNRAKMLIIDNIYFTYLYTRTALTLLTLSQHTMSLFSQLSRCFPSSSNLSSLCVSTWWAAGSSAAGGLRHSPLQRVPLSCLSALIILAMAHLSDDELCLGLVPSASRVNETWMFGRECELSQQ